MLVVLGYLIGYAILARLATILVDPPEPPRSVAGLGLLCLTEALTVALMASLQT